MRINSSSKEIINDYIISIVIEFAILSVLICAFYFCVGKGPLIQESKIVGDEVSSPTFGRLIYGVISFIMFFITSVIASKSANNGQDTKAFWFGFASGILLWQSLGEVSWHFSVNDINFTPLENITSFPISIIASLLFIYCRRNHSFDWGILITYLSFMCNWIGHYITIGIYPLFSSIIDKQLWIISVSLIAGIIVIALSIIYLFFRVKTKRGRMLASIITYIGLAIIAFGFIE